MSTFQHGISLKKKGFLPSFFLISSWHELQSLGGIRDLLLAAAENEISSKEARGQIVVPSKKINFKYLISLTFKNELDFANKL